MKNLIFFDIDGTIVTEKDGRHFIPDSFFDTLKLLKEAGNLCFINSGRALSEIEDFLLNLGMDGLICGCGTYISYNGKELFHKTIPLELGNEIMKDLHTYKLQWLLEGKSTLYYSSLPYTTHIGDFKENHMLTFPDICSLVSPEDAHDLAFDKFCICLSDESNFEPFYNKYKEVLTFIDRGNSFYEIVPVPYSKASGMQFLMDYFDIPLANTYAIGDSTNDLPMLDFAGTGIAMGGSPKEVTVSADYITTSVIDDGIYNAMKHFNLI